VDEQQRHEHVSGEQQPEETGQDTEDQRHPAGSLQQADDDSGKLRRGDAQRGQESADTADAHLEELLLPVHDENDADNDSQQRDPPGPDRLFTPRYEVHELVPSFLIYL
jgi:hypothetical protein